MGRQAEGPGPAWGSLRRRSAWQEALLAVAILSSCFLLTQAQETAAINVTVEPSRPLEGQDLTLTPGGKPDFLVCSWFRGEQATRNRIFTYIRSPPEQQNGTGFTGRETGGPGCSLSIKSLRVNDTGLYIVEKTVSGGPETGRVQIEVFEKLLPPTLRPADPLVEEHANVTLNCTTSEGSSTSVSWFRDGGAVPAKSVLSERNRTLTISDISQNDLGVYTCVAWNPANSAMSNPSRIAFNSPTPSDPSGGLSGGQIAGIVIGCLVGVALIVVVLYFALKNTALGRMDQHASNGNIPSAPGHNQGVTDTKPTAGEEDIQYTTLAFNSSSPPQPSLGTTVPLESGTIYSVIKKK